MRITPLNLMMTLIATWEIMSRFLAKKKFMKSLKFISVLKRDQAK